mgnify:CR=1 FL=1
MSASAFFLASREQEIFRSPAGWDFEIYSLAPRDFWFSKANLPVCEGCEIVRYDFRGRTRFRAGMNVPKLQINFIDSYSSVAARLQGRGNIESVVMITAKGDAWDGVSDLGALGIEVNFDERLAAKILTPDIAGCLEAGGPRGRSMVVPLNPVAAQLKQNAQMFLSAFDHTYRLFGQQCDVEPLTLGLAGTPIGGSAVAEETLVELARNAISACAVPHGDTSGSARRRAIALDVEKMLWEPPFIFDDHFDASLGDFSKMFGVSTRTIQMAVQEQFGIGFVALRRLIRLTQVRREIYASRGRSSLTYISSDYRLHFGRLSREYRELFGLSPSAERKRAASVS